MLAALNGLNRVFIAAPESCEGNQGMDDGYNLVEPGLSAGVPHRRRPVGAAWIIPKLHVAIGGAIRLFKITAKVLFVEERHKEAAYNGEVR